MNMFIHGSLSHMFSPDCLFMKIFAHVCHMGREKLALDSPWECSCSTHLVHAITVPWPDDDDLLIAATASSTAGTCFLCAKDHMLMSCLLLFDIQKDPFHWKTLLHALGTSGPSLAPASGSKQVHAILNGSSSMPKPDPSALLPDGVSDGSPYASDF